MRAGYRAGQFWKALSPVSDQAGIELAESILSPALMAQFSEMQLSEVNHSLQVLRKLISADERHPDLLAAALLHDVGKSRSPLHLWERVVVVLVKQFFPATYRKWGNTGDLHSWKHMFVVAEQHPAWGAFLAGEGGASALTVELIRRHQEPRNPVTLDEVVSGEQPLVSYLLYQLQLSDEES